MQVDFKVEDVNPEWLGLATELMNGYDSNTHTLQEYFTKWQNLIKISEYLPKIDNNNNRYKYKTSVPQLLNRHSPENNKQLLVISYENFLIQFPYCEQYWINFANWVFKFGDTDKAHEIYLKSLDIVPKSLLIWVNYLKFCELTVLKFDELFEIFESCRKSIGLHYYSHLIYDLYLNFLQRNSKEKLYYSLLRRIIELPIYHYSKYFKKFIKLIEDSNLKTIKLLITTKDLSNITKSSTPISWSDLLRNQQLFKEVKSDLRKRFIDIYITVQYNSYQIWQFEKNLTNQFFKINNLSKIELVNWDNYLQYIENNNLLISHKENEESISKNNKLMVKLIYERCLISTCNYPHFWLKFSNWYLNLNDIENAKLILEKGIYITPITNLKLRLRLIDLNILTNEIDKAKKLTLELITLLPNSLEPFLKMCQLIKLTTTSTKNLLNFIKEKLISLQESNYEYQFDYLFVEILTYNNIPIDELILFFKFFENSKKSLFFWKSYYNLFYLPTVDNSNIKDLDHVLKEIKEKSLLMINENEKSKLMKFLNYYGDDDDKFAEFAY